MAELIAAHLAPAVSLWLLCVLILKAIAFLISVVQEMLCLMAKVVSKLMPLASMSGVVAILEPASLTERISWEITLAQLVGCLLDMATM